MTEFVAWPKTPRMDKALHCIITEKIDGTNAQIVIEDGKVVLIGSRNRAIEPDSDNYGFARWVRDNESDIVRLGDGRHYGEWYGQGIQRGYGLKEKRFALFNVLRFKDVELPNRVETVPFMYAGDFHEATVDDSMRTLKGRSFVNSFDNPEGVIVHFPTLGGSFKVTFEHSEGKWKDAA